MSVLSFVSTFVTNVATPSLTLSIDLVFPVAVTLFMHYSYIVIRTSTNKTAHYSFGAIAIISYSNVGSKID